VYVVGCGPSLEGFGWELLADKITVAVNGAVQDVPQLKYFLTADSRFARMAWVANFWHTPAIKVLVMRQDHAHWNWVAPSLSRWDWHITPARFDGQIGFTEEEFCTGQNSGFCGMQLAVLLGAARIHLLGMDFCGGPAGNYHKRYSSNPMKWAEFLTHFKTAAGILKACGIELISHSSVSLLNSYVRYAPLEVPNVS